jgi:hypothetical protein
MKQLGLLITLFTLTSYCFGQNLSDTVVVYVENRVEIKIVISDYHELKSSGKVTLMLDKFEDLMDKIGSQLQSGKPERIVFTPDSSLILEPGDPKVIYLYNGDQLNNTGFRDQAVIKGEDFKLMITTTDLSKISDLPLSECIKKVIGILPAKSRWSKSLYYECVDGKISLLEMKNNELDMLEINLGAGAGLIRNTWVPDLSLGIGVGFKQKGKLRYPYISSNMLFNFDAENKIRMNIFLNLGYGWNIGKGGKKKDMLGLELGYLISRQGDLFGQNTLKMGFNWSPVKGVFVSPQLYMTDKFNSVYPGIRIGFGF